ncbi:MAG: hypothetical protein AAFU79_02025 [Myxococcota bacterium]
MILRRAQELLDERHPYQFDARIMETHRAPERQWQLFRKGRRLVKGKWHRVGRTVTNARPHQSAHCVTMEDGTPAAMAADFWVVCKVPITWRGKHAQAGHILPDGHAAWACIPAAAWIAGGEQVRIGAAFGTIQDWPHVELADWRKRAPRGIVRTS